VGIVGPNGSGKSNVIDAVRWVMGESSAKNLRGESMSDVIFNGSSTRKPVGQASIELVFDNSDGSLGGQYATYAEISIKRMVLRDGQSSYYLNGARCRRRDITDIFLGTGLGPRSYAIIEQGMISRLIEAKPEELRELLEEAAGISKYKERRRETETRIRHTRENISRLNDLQDELSKQIEKLQRQAKTAERYKELKQEERAIRGQWLAVQWRHLDTDVGARETDLARLDTQQEGAIAAQRQTEAAIEHARLAHTEASDHFNTVQGEYYRLGADIAAKENAIQTQRERRSQLENDLRQLDKAQGEAQANLQADEARVRELDTRVALLGPQLEEWAEQVESLADQLRVHESAVQTWQNEWNGFSQQAAEPGQRAGVERTRITHLEDTARQNQQRLVRLQEESNSLDTGLLEQELEALDEDLMSAQQQADAQLSKMQLGLTQVSSQRSRNHEITERIAQRRQAMQQCSGRIASLEALQEAAFNQGAVETKRWLTAQGLDAAPRVAQNLDVDAGWEQAVETALGAHLEAVCVNDVRDVASALSAVGKGTLGLLESGVSLAPIAAGGNNVRLASKVRCPWDMQTLLSGVYCADSLDHALGMQRQLAAHESVVTRDGIWLGANWLRINHATDARAGVLQRSKDLRKLQVDRTELEQEIALLVEELEQGKAALQDYESQRETLQKEMTQIERRVGEIKASRSGKLARVEQARSRKIRLGQEIDELQTALRTNQSTVAEARARLEQALEDMERIEERRRQLNASRDDLRRAVDMARGHHNEARTREQELRLESRSAVAALESTRQNLQRMERQLANANERRETVQAMLQQIHAPLETFGHELENLLVARLEMDARLTEARSRVEAIDAELRELNHRRLGEEQHVSRSRDALGNARVQLETLRVRRETVEQQTQEGGYVLADVLAALPEDADVAALAEGLAQLEQRISRLGPINLAAIDEYNEQAERKRYLDAQLADLNEALETLESAIKRIDRETRARFKETFDKVNDGMGQMFPKLFGGGQCYLEMTGEDLLDTGITIMARPPGKRISNIHMLSGGEKALTAVAMVFSIFQLNPAPFCMLDEVDAPLDEANVGRFSSLVKEMAERVQFIFITHNKATMEIAEHLNGVTMHEPGVSRMVTVDVEEAAQLAAM